MNNRENSLLIFAPIIKFKRVSNFITLCDLFIICSSCKKHEGSTHFYIHIHRFNSIIYKSISFHEFPRDHSIPFQFPPYIPTPFHSILQEREKILKFASYFCYSTFLQRQEKKHSLFHSTKNSTRYKKKKKSK